jgi:hypothetical protein
MLEQKKGLPSVSARLTQRCNVVFPKSNMSSVKMSKLKLKAIKC